SIGVILSARTVIFVQFNFVLYVAVIMLVPVIAAIIYPWKRKDEYERAPKLVNFKVGGVPGITIIGIITLGYLIWLIASTFLYPAVGGAITIFTIAWFLSFIASGFVIFYGMRAYRLRKEGIDIMWTYKEIPPL
ncbi:MAG: hypothetical protein ACP5M8_08005, partial [Caldisphaera sp.]